MCLFFQLGRANGGIAKAVAGLQDRHRFLIAVRNLDLRNQACPEILRLPGSRGQEHGLQAIGLRTHAVDGRKLRTVGQLVDVVAGLVLAVLGRIGRRENHRSGTFNR